MGGALLDAAQCRLQADFTPVRRCYLRRQGCASRILISVIVELRARS